MFQKFTSIFTDDLQALFNSSEQHHCELIAAIKFLNYMTSLLKLSEINRLLIEESIRDEHQANTHYLRYKAEIERLAFHPLTKWEHGRDLFFDECNFHRRSSDFFSREIEIAFEREKLTLSLSDHVMALYESDEKDKYVHFMPVELDQESFTWTLPKDGSKRKEISIDDDNTSRHQNELVDNILVPFIKGISVDDFAMIIDDENDLLSAFRSEIQVEQQASHQIC